MDLELVWTERRQRYLALMEDVQTDQGHNAESFNRKWRAVADILKEELWRHGGWRSQWQFLTRGAGVPARYGKPLARIAALGDAWPYRDFQEHPPRQLRAVAALLEEKARVGGDQSCLPVQLRRRGVLEPVPLQQAKARHTHRERRRLRRMPDQALQRGELVVLIHGLGRTRFSMSKAERTMLSRGFLTANVNYKSRAGTYEELADRVWDAAKEYAGHFDRVHFLTHSLGGVLVRQMLKQEMVKNVARVVMLAPPNKGSEVVDALRRWPSIPVLMGPVFQQLSTDSGLAQRLGPARAPTAVITGNRTQRPFNLAFTGPNDGKVSVESARLEGMEAFLVVDENHTRIVKSLPVHQAAANYLETGRLRTEEAFATRYRRYGEVVLVEEAAQLEVGDFFPEPT